MFEKVTGLKHFTLEQLSTLLTEIEAIWQNLRKLVLSTQNTPVYNIPVACISYSVSAMQNLLDFLNLLWILIHDKSLVLIRDELLIHHISEFHKEFTLRSQN